VRVLLDTHTFLWFNANDKRLSAAALEVIAQGDNEVLLSAVSAWEIATKYSLGRLPDLKEAPGAYLPARMAHYGFAALPITIGHSAHIATLPPIHRDPFDRILIAQAQLEGIAIVTSDPNIRRYEVEVVW
jgi:PIN domain nuclease of toxin-antitoxin system